MRTRVRTLRATASDWSAIREEIKRRVTCSAVCELATLQPRNGRWPCPNPIHKGQSRGPDLTMNREDSGWRCHACNAGGSVFDLAVHVGAARDFADAMQILAALSGVELPNLHLRWQKQNGTQTQNQMQMRSGSEMERDAAAVPRERAAEIRRRFAAAMQRHFTPDTIGAEYLRSRHIPFAAAKSAGCGWIAEPAAAEAVLRKKYSSAELRAAGLIGKTGKFLGRRHRLVLADPNGGTGEFLALRNISGVAEAEAKATAGSGPKEFACGRGVLGYTAEMFASTTVVSGAAQCDSPIVLWCEGTTDWLTAYSLGFIALCVPGAGQWRYAIEAIRKDIARGACDANGANDANDANGVAPRTMMRSCARHVILFDGDAAGQRGAMQFESALHAELHAADFDSHIRIAAPVSAAAGSTCKDLSDCVRLGAGREELEAIFAALF